ncbi:MAG: hypothetical protein D3907_05795, partial [Candidatus Electrothrix sp. AUS3]|nr:hypothetical protein [Candidatus Electrothrix gigas]
GKQITLFTGYTDSVTGMAFSPDSKKLAFAFSDNVLRLWDIASSKQLIAFTGHTDSVTGITFNPDSKKLASSSLDNTVRLWDITNGKQLIAFTVHTAVHSMVFSPDGKKLASSSYDGTVRLWDTTPFIADDKTLISASSNKTASRLFPRNSKSTPLYHTFIDAVKFLWQLDVQGLEIVETKRRTPADLKKYGTLLNPPPPGQSKFDQVLEWAQKQQEQ